MMEYKEETYITIISGIIKDTGMVGKEYLVKENKHECE